MNPKQNYRGPSSIDTATADFENRSQSFAVANEQKSQFSGLSQPAVQARFMQVDHDDPAEKASEPVGEKIKGLDDAKLEKPSEGEKAKKPKVESTPCKTSKKAKPLPVNNNVPDNSLGGFGDTKRLAANFSFGACLIGSDWRFYLKSLGVPIKIVVRPANFKLGKREWKNIENANSAEINSGNIKNVIWQLTPNYTRKFKAPCSGVNYPQTVKNYPRRQGFWNQKITQEHEEYHKKEWIKHYQSELVKAENEIVNTITLPAASAKNEAEAVAAMNKKMSDIMIKAYKDATALYCPNREINAYNKDEPKYKSLVADIEARGKKEKWI